jgi:hypothetical protein
MVRASATIADPVAMSLFTGDLLFLRMPAPEEVLRSPPEIGFKVTTAVTRTKPAAS